ncbi:MAG: RsmD family RNA methyltransferase [Pseudarcicella sp.]|nr:RsmD family RNA methyltransferase [Pseudarcicella sp.]MBP6409874.1 RsmD family RNA methyltransferase [Pseudarcicella sp.]
MQIFTNDDFQFIFDNINADTHQLLLQNALKDAHKTKNIVLQIQARQKAKLKIPTWEACKTLIFDSSLSLEQSSSELTAIYKSHLIPPNSNQMADLTGGMGVDIAFMSQKMQKAYHIERNKSLSQTTAYNFKQLEINNVEFLNTEASQFLENHNASLDLVYLDPARRDNSGDKVVSLASCEPNILHIKDTIFGKTNRILLKTSPMLDIDTAINQLQNVKKIHILAVENEVKELIFDLEKDYNQACEYQAVNLLKNKPSQYFSGNKQDETNAKADFSAPLNYLYEPNASVLKAGFFKLFAQKNDLKKISSNSHLYTSDHYDDNVQARIFTIVAVCKLDKKQIQAHCPEGKANISTRNFPLKPDQIRKKIELKDGGDIYLFATTDQQNNKIVLVCKKKY